MLWLLKKSQLGDFLPNRRLDDALSSLDVGTWYVLKLDGVRVWADNLRFGVSEYTSLYVAELISNTWILLLGTRIIQLDKLSVISTRFWLGRNDFSFFLLLDLDDPMTVISFLKQVLVILFFNLRVVYLRSRLG